MPGVTVTTSTRTGPMTPVAAPSGQLFLVGLAERGPAYLDGVDNAASGAEAVLVRSVSEFELHFGQRPTYGYLYDAIRTFFEEGGTRAWVARVAGPAATKGTLDLKDQGAGAGLTSLTVDALSVGTVVPTVEVQAGTLADTFRLIFTLNGGTPRQIREDYNNLTSPADAVARVNLSSALVRVSAPADATAAPLNNPRVLAPTVLAAGTDDRAAVTDTMRVDALSLFPIELGDGAVAIPGSTGAAVWAGLVAHAEANRRLALLASSLGNDVGTMLEEASTVNSEYAGLFAPWVKIPDGAGGIRSIPPEAYVAACRNRAHLSEGPWRAPGGALAVTTYVAGVDQVFGRADADALDSGRVNAIRVIANSVRLYGWRSLSADEANYRLLTGRDLLNRLVVEGERRLEQYVFRTIDGRGQLLSAIAGTLIGMVDPMARAGGLFALVDPVDNRLIDPGYSVVADASINTPETLAADEVRARISVRVSPTGALITLDIVKAGLTAAI